MDLRDPVVIQGLVATGAAAGIVAAAAWWLYASRADRTVAPVAASVPLARGLAWALGIAGFQLLIGGLWDASQHIKTGRVVGGSDFLWPSHIVIYSSFLLSLAASGVAMGRVSGAARAAGLTDVRLWFRRQPLLGTVVLASAYELLALPGDALWHEIFGIDLTAWSPPHLTIALMMATVLIAAAATLLDASGRAGTRRPAVAAVILIALALNVAYLVGVLEWELPVPMSAQVAARPAWSYLVVSGLLAFATLAVGRALLPARWTATAIALAFVGTRLAVTLALGMTDQVVPAFSIVPLAGAVLFDLSAVLWRAPIVHAAAFTLGYAIVALPQLAIRTELPALDLATQAIAIAVLFIGCALVGSVIARTWRVSWERPRLSSTAPRPAGIR